jgi:hypothetical protein
MDREAEARTTKDADDSKSLYVWLTIGIQAVMFVGLAWFAIRGDWENVFLTVLVIALTLGPAFLLRKSRVYLPPEFQLIAVGFIFLSLFLGSAADLYYRFWWWDIVLHASSGVLMGIIGFVTLFLMNETDRLPQRVKPGFLCFFGLTFAMFLAVLWEIVEFAVDKIAPDINMQSNETGVDDTMQDLIVCLIGAIVVALMGWSYFKTGRYSFLADGISAFMKKNPKLFRGKRRRIEEATKNEA